MSKVLTITITGEDEVDFGVALERIADQVGEGFTSGHDRNETASYVFTIQDGE